MTESATPETVHRPAHWSRERVVCCACRVRWPCTAAVDIAEQIKSKRAAGDKRVVPWWYIPIIAVRDPQ